MSAGEEGAIEEWMNQNPPEQTAEQAHIENVVTSIEIFMQGLHRKFASKRLAKSEFFALTPDDVDYICSL